MANYATLKTAIQNVIKTNGNNEITGALLQQSLLAMINSLGSDFQFVGVANENTTPGTPDQNIFYIAGPGTYPNFTAVVKDGYIGIFKYNGSWSVDYIAFGKKYDDAISEILTKIGDFQLSYGDAISAPHESGNLLKSDGSVVSSTADISDFVEIGNGIKTQVRTPSNVSYAGYCLYDENQNFVRSYRASGTGETLEELLISPENGVKYVRWQTPFSAGTYPSRFSYYPVINTIADLVAKIPIIEQELADIKQIIGDITLSYSDNITAQFVRNKILLESDGTLADSTGAMTSDFIEIGNGIKFTTRLAGNTSYASYCIYDENKNFVRSVRINASTGVNTVVELGAYNGFVRWVMANNPTVTTYNIIVGTIAERIEDINAKLQLVGLDDFRSKVLFDKSAGLLKNDGTVDETLTSRRHSDYIPFVDDVILYNAFQASTAYAMVCLYDENKNFLSYIHGTSTQTRYDTVTVSKSINRNAHYIRYSLASNTLECAAEIALSIKQYVDRVALSESYGKKVAIFGGSFASNYYASEGLKKWQSRLALEITNYAVGGAGFTSLASSLINTQVDAACADGVAPYDIYILWASGNDFSAQATIGNQNDYTSEDNYTNLDTQSGGINYCVKKILEKAPTAKIAIFTSLRYLSQNAGWNPFYNGSGNGMKAYVDGQIACANRWGIPVLNQFLEFPMNPYNSAQFVVSDGTHLNPTAYEYIANRQIDFLSGV